MFLLFTTLLFGFTNQQETPNIQSKKEDCSPPTNEMIFELSKSYYETNGLWAGIFWLDAKQKSKTIHTSPTPIEYHLRYQYKPIPNNPLQRTDSGTDQRIFFLECDKTWQVSNMGPFMSAQFDSE